MSRVQLGWRWLFGILLGISLCGCLPSGDGALDEQKEPRFVEGKKLLNQLDYQGAIGAFEKALEVNPRSASAHFELGWLYEQRAADPAAAIYHYERFLKLRSPTDGRTDIAQQHISSCKMELVKSVSTLGPLPSSVQRDLERLILENKELKGRLAQWEAYYNSSRNAAAPVNPTTQGAAAAAIVAGATAPAASVTRPTVAATAVQPTRSPAQPSMTPAPRATGTTTATVTARAHTVKSGETPTIIARSYGVTVNALMAANPQARPTHLHVGQVLNIPAP